MLDAQNVGQMRHGPFVRPALFFQAIIGLTEAAPKGPQGVVSADRVLQRLIRPGTFDRNREVHVMGLMGGRRNDRGLDIVERQERLRKRPVVMAQAGFYISAVRTDENWLRSGYMPVIEE